MLENPCCEEATEVAVPEHVAAPATCSYHSETVATAECQLCGRKLCQVCLLAFDNGAKACADCCLNVAPEALSTRRGVFFVAAVLLSVLFFPLFFWAPIFVASTAAVAAVIFAFGVLEKNKPNPWYAWIAICTACLCLLLTAVGYFMILHSS